MSDVEPTEHFEQAEHAEHAAHSGNPFLARVAVTIAILAVIAAFIGSLETIETAATIDAKSQATLFQDKATDSWGFYQAKSLKKNLYDIAAGPVVPGANADNFKAQAKHNEEDQELISLAAKTQEELTEQSLRSSGEARTPPQDPHDRGDPAPHFNRDRDDLDHPPGRALAMVCGARPRPLGRSGRGLRLSLGRVGLQKLSARRSPVPSSADRSEARHSHPSAIGV